MLSGGRVGGHWEQRQGYGHQLAVCRVQWRLYTPASAGPRRLRGCLGAETRRHKQYKQQSTWRPPTHLHLHPQPRHVSIHLHYKHLYTLVNMCCLLWWSKWSLSSIMRKNINQQSERNVSQIIISIQHNNHRKSQLDELRPTRHQFGTKCWALSSNMNI